jgi:DNA-binding CsgD family transcriptional regulator
MLAVATAISLRGGSQEVSALNGQSVLSPSTLDSIMSCQSLPAVAGNLLRPVADAVDADSAVYLRFRHDGAGEPFICESAYMGGDPDSLDRYESGYFIDDPVLRPLIERSDTWRDTQGPVRFQLNAQVKKRTLRGSDYFRNFLKPHDLGDIIGIAFPFECDGPQMLCLGIHRYAGRPDFSEAQTSLLDALERPVRMVLETLCLRASIAEQSALISALDSTAAGVEFAVFDTSLHLLRGSRRICELFGGQGRDSASQQSLRAAAAALGEPAVLPEPARTALELPGGLRGELRRIEGGRGCHYVLILRECGGAAAARAGLAAALPSGERLTAREQQVIDEVARGGSNARIAETLGISVRTVENHLRSVYDKLGINSRTQLVSLLFAP